jgi:hypothetical protein
VTGNFSPLGVDTGSDPEMWICDRTGQIGLYDTANGRLVAGTQHATGLPLSDITFIGDQMYGTTHTALYKVNNQTGAVQTVTTYNFNQGINALVEHDGVLYAASQTSKETYAIHSDGTVTDYANVPYKSAGGLAWSGDTLYESVRLGYLSGLEFGHSLDGLYDVTNHRLMGTFKNVDDAIIPDVFGMADNGSAMYAVENNNIFEVNLRNAQLTALGHDSRYGLLKNTGAAFVNE